MPQKQSDTEPQDEYNDDIDEHRFSPEETLIIFDWDDTVMPSSWVEGLRTGEDESSEVLVSQDQKEQLEDLARLATETLGLAQQLGTVLLVTNAQQGWVELSYQRYMPTLLPALASVRIMSARTRFETEQVSSPFEWKHRAFLCEIGRVFRDKSRRRNILSFGDSGHEREALIKSTANMHNTRTKSVKFLDRPGVHELGKQHAVMVKCLKQIVHHDGNLDLCLRVRSDCTEG